MTFKKLKPDKVEKLVRRSRPEAFSQRGWRIEEELGTGPRNNKLEEWLVRKKENRMCCLRRQLKTFHEESIK